MKKYTKLFALFLVLTLAACFEPPLKDNLRSSARVPQAQAVDVPARSYEFKDHSFGQVDDSFMPPGTIKVALLAPLTGKAAKIGKALADAAQLGIYTEGSSNVRVVPYDTKGTPEGAVEAVYAALESSPNVIIGPLFGNEAKQIAPIARSKDVNVFAFSNDKKVAGNGVYLMGLMPAQQTERLVEFASQRGLESFAAAVPNNVLGDEVSASLRSSASIYRKEVYFTDSYSSLQPNYTQVASDIATKLAEKGDLSSQTHGLLLPESGAGIKNLLANLRQQGLASDKLRFMGVNGWDNAETAALSDLNGAWYTAVPAKDMNSFMNNFQENFGYRPPQIASLAYDAVLLTAELGLDGLNEISITRREGFYGSNGAYRFGVDGVNERAYDVLEISGGSTTVVDEAPKYFQ